MQLGVQTHFAQGWSASLLTKLAELGVTEIRDGQTWSQVEKTAGQYNFTPSLVNYMDRAENLGVEAMLVFASGNTLYDGGYTPYTAEGRQAYANYIVAVLQKYGSQVEEIEIWNEFNNANAFTGPAAGNDSFYYNELLKTVWNTVKPLFPDVKILGGSVNVIGVGALESIFKLGALNYMDGVVVHPYRSAPEHVDDEILHLQDVMSRYGAVKPIYATEFGSEFDNPADVPDFMLKMVTLMASVHVEEAYWYALIDQTWFKNMGLYTTKGEEKPAAEAFAFIQKELLVHGDPVRIDTGDDLTLVYRFGADTYVMWSAGRDVAFNGGGAFFDAMGRAIGAPTTLTMTPIVFKGSGYALAENTVVADTLMQFNEGDWQYFAKDKNGKLTSLSLTDWDWTSYLGSKYTNPLQVNMASVAPSGNGINPVSVVERFVSDRDQILNIKGEWTTGATGDGVDLHILVNGVEVFVEIFHGTFALDGFKIDLKAGDKLDFVLGPNQTFGGDGTKRHITLTRVAPEPDHPVIMGTDASETLSGTNGNDTIFGLAGDDILLGGSGDDILDGGTGKNRIDGGEGFDIVSFANADTGVTVKLGYVSNQTISATTVDRLLNIEGVIGSAFDDVLSGDEADQWFWGGAGDDTFKASGGADTIDGGSGVDLLTFANFGRGVTVSLASAEVQSLGEEDSIRVTGVERLIGSYHADRLTASDSGSELAGGVGDDFLIGGAGDDQLIGSAGSDTASYERASAGVTVSLLVTTAQATGAGNDTLTGIENLVGSAFNDILIGSAGANVLNGGAGNDVLTGGSGADLLTGGAGADTFVYLAATDSRPSTADTIFDFSHAQGDRINLEGIDASTKASGNQAFVIADAFTRSAGQLVIGSEQGGYFVQGDVNGDGVADFGIHVVTTGPLTASDFYL